MGDQKNLFLAIGLSVAIIVVFQFLFPQQTVMTPVADKKYIEELQPSTSIDENQSIVSETVRSKEEIISIDNRIEIITPTLKGSINSPKFSLFKDKAIALTVKSLLPKSSEIVAEVTLLGFLDNDS